jgi:error-prone DNA polymerase
VTAYAELAVTTNFSFLRGAAHPDEYVKQAVALGLAGIGIADRNSVAGVVRAYSAAEELNELIGKTSANAARLKIAVGARLVFADGTADILAYPRDRLSWGRLTQLLTVGKSRGEKGECVLFLADLLEHIANLNLILLPPRRLNARELDATLAALKRAASRQSVWLAASMLYRGDDTRRLTRLAAIAERALVPLIAVNDVLYHVAERRPLQDVVTCIREHVTIDAAGRLLEANAERHLKPGHEMARLFRRAPEAIDQTLRFLDRCNFSLGELRKTEYPDENRVGFPTPQDALVSLAEEGFRRRYPGGSAKVRYALDRELAITSDLHYAPYFLTVHDIVRFARQKGILCQGRGSAANSVICYCLGITEVNPEKVDLLFERFVSEERREPPDIDVDFEHERREEVIQYIYNKYGRHHANIAATVISYRGRSAVREVGKAFGLSEDTIASLAGTMWGWSMDGVSDAEARRAGLDPADPRLKQVMALTQELMGFPRHLSQHVGGFLITRSRIDQVVPVENAAMEDRTVIEWDKNDLEELRLLKVDVLGLGMLSCLRRGFDLLREHYRLPCTLPEILQNEATEEARPVYRMIRRADTIGVFQIESRAQMSMLPRLQPNEFYDLVIEVAIVRPGPIQGKMVHPYLRRREALRATGREPVYPFPQGGDENELKDILKKTLGVPLFQEQAMRIAIVAAKFTPPEADRLRRAMATFKRVGTIKTFQDKFILGMVRRGYDPAFAENCFSQIRGFGEYGFPESHAASFANLVYASCWMKCRYPDVFAAALINSQPMGFYAPAQIVRDAQEHGVEVRPVDVNRSDWDCTLEIPHPEVRAQRASKDDVALHPRHATMQDDIRTTHVLRLGLRQVSGFSQTHALRIESVRGRGFDSVRDLWLRSRLPPAALERLANADAFRSLGLDRREALWAVRALRRSGDKDDLPLFAHATMSEQEPDASLPPMPPGEHVVEDYRHLHLSLKAHPVSFLRQALNARRVTPHERLRNIPSGRRVTVAGLVLVRQRPGSANGVIFMTLEDETGIANTIVWPKVFETFRPVVLGARLTAVTGKVQNAQGVIHVVAEQIEDFTPLLKALSDDATQMDASGPNDEVKRPVPDDPRTLLRRNGLLRLLRQDPELAAELIETAKVMPKGRNFH